MCLRPLKEIQAEMARDFPGAMAIPLSDAEQDATKKFDDAVRSIQSDLVRRGEHAAAADLADTLDHFLAELDKQKPIRDGGYFADEVRRDVGAVRPLCEAVEGMLVAWHEMKKARWRLGA